jgi:hypothetical protein
VETTFGFIPGLPAPKVAATYVRQHMATMIDSLPMLLFVADQTLATQKEFKTYRKRVQKIGGMDTILDEPANPRKHDCMAMLQYGVAELHQRLQQKAAFYGSDTVRPASSGIPDWLQESLDRARNNQSSIHLGPGTAA